MGIVKEDFMKIIKEGDVSVVMSNFGSKHSYFGWPSVARLQNGKIAVVASGFRVQHVCPFGKTVIAFSEDEGNTYTLPMPVVDTVMDDRDGGITPFGESGVVVTSFNNELDLYRGRPDSTPYMKAYLDLLTDEDEAREYGSTFRISRDCCVTFGPVQKSPVTSPHGPLALPEGGFLWVGRAMKPLKPDPAYRDFIQAWHMDEDGAFTFVGEIEQIFDEDGELLTSCEPHTILLEDGTLLTHIRVQRKGKDPSQKVFTIYQSTSQDGGKTWTRPERILGQTGGAPSHLFRHSSGVLLATYGYREAPYGVKVMFSTDHGKTWDVDHDLYVNGVNWDLGYPATVELKDGSLLTVFYAHRTAEEPALILQQKWRFEK